MILGSFLMIFGSFLMVFSIIFDDFSWIFLKTAGGPGGGSPPGSYFFSHGGTPWISKERWSKVVDFFELIAVADLHINVRRGDPNHNRAVHVHCIEQLGIKRLLAIQETTLRCLMKTLILMLMRKGLPIKREAVLIWQQTSSSERTLVWLCNSTIWP